MILSDNTKVHDLLTTYPFLEDFLVAYHSKFEMLKNKMARATIGRVATLRTAAGIAGIDIDAFLEAIAAQIEAHTGQRPQVERSSHQAPLTREQRIEELKAIVTDLHAGGDLEQAKARFAKAVEDVEASEIAAMEEELIRSGLPVSEVQRLCDVHVGAFKPALDKHANVDAPPGHPVHTYQRENQVITELADALGAVARAVEAGDATDENFAQAERILGELQAVDNHYQRKENQLFPLLERHGVTGPSQVMWGVHDQIRAALKTTRDALARRDGAQFASAAVSLTRDLVEMVYKEEKILFPMAMETLTEEEWAEVRRGEDTLGYGLAEPAAPWPTGQAEPAQPAAGGETPGRLWVTTGDVTVEQLNLLFSHLPVDLTFVDENDEVRFYSEGPERIFPRSPAVIGRKVQNCHPPKSLHMVEEILESFRSGKQDVAEFWLQMNGRFIHIRYFAVRDAAGAYRGCLEVSQDITQIRALQGERRLLDWSRP